MIFDCWRCGKKWNDFKYNVCSHCGAPKKRPEEAKPEEVQSSFGFMNGNFTLAGDPPKADEPSFDPGGGESGGGGASGDFSTDSSSSS